MTDKICEYCECKFYNKNKVFCSRECQIRHMRLRICQGCNKPKIKDEDQQIHYCSKECEEKHSRFMFKSNLMAALGLGWMYSNKCELIGVSYSFIDEEKQKIETHTINFKENS